MCPAVLLLPRKKYHPYDDPRDFAYRIEVKENAPDLLRRALSRAPVDVVGTGDYQAAENKFGLSRRMLKVCLELGFPVSVLERSPSVLHDLDLLKAITERAGALTMWSIISDWRRVALHLKEPCAQYAISNHMPRPIIPGDKRSLVKRVVEALGP